MIEPEETPNIKILMYHRVIRKGDRKGDPLSVSEEAFREQMNWIQKFGFTTITFFDYQLYLEGKLTLPRKPIIITFDDGYQDTYTRALPILHEKEMRAVIFVLGNRGLKRAWWESGDPDDLCLLMSDSQIQEAHALGFEIGAHTMNHLALGELDEEEVRHEVQGSKQAIEELLQEEVLSISYPYGSLNQSVLDITAEGGFRFGCGVFTGPPRFGTNMFDLRRLAIKQEMGPAQFLMRLLTPWQYLEWAWSRRNNLSQISDLTRFRRYFKTTTAPGEG